MEVNNIDVTYTYVKSHPDMGPNYLQALKTKNDVQYTFDNIVEANEYKIEVEALHGKKNVFLLKVTSEILQVFD